MSALGRYHGHRGRMLFGANFAGTTPTHSAHRNLRCGRGGCRRSGGCGYWWRWRSLTQSSSKLGRIGQVRGGRNEQKIGIVLPRRRDAQRVGVFAGIHGWSCSRRRRLQRRGNALRLTHNTAARLIMIPLLCNTNETKHQQRQRVEPTKLVRQ
jgi:hypothetical protein